MAEVPDFHTSGVEDGDELVFHNQSECPVGSAVTERGIAVPGRGYYRTLCAHCRSIVDGYKRVDPL
jgi:hypothetical protein